MGGTLRTYVHVHDENGQSHAFGPDDEVPGWAEKLITNPAAWEGTPESAAADADAGGEQAGGTPPGEPPRSGSGSGRDPWAAYAATHGVEVPDDAKRDDIIAALASAGIVKE